MKRIAACLLALGMLSQGVAAWAEESVTYSGVHLCCGACNRAVQNAISKVQGVTAKVDGDAGTVTLTAADAKQLKAGAKALADAGFHGTADKKDFALPDDSGATQEKVQRIVLVGVHNCCGGCASAVEDACKEVDGVKAVAIGSRQPKCVVEGEFVPAAVVKALNDAGFHVRVEK